MPGPNGYGSTGKARKMIGVARPRPQQMSEKERKDAIDRYMKRATPPRFVRIDND